MLLVSAVLTACGGGASTTTTASAGASAAATSAATTTPSAGGGASSAPSAASGPKLSDVLAAGKLSTYKITYKISATGAGADAMNGEQTWYFKPPRTRFDFSSSQGGQVTTISYFKLPEGTFFCSGSGGDAQCFNGGQAGIGSLIDSNIAMNTQQGLIDHPEQYGATFKEMKTIAGQTGYCYTVTGTAASFNTGTFCYTKEGLALLSQYTAQGATLSMEATNVSTTVADSDFKLPATPIGR